MKPLLSLLFTLFIFRIVAQPPPGRPTRQDTLKGSITPERRWWDVLHYDLTVEPDYGTKAILGSNTIEYRVVEAVHTSEMQIDLQAPLTIDSVRRFIRR